MHRKHPGLRSQFDRILARIEAGYVDQAIIHLTGVLDTLMLQNCDVKAVRAALTTHPLGAALQQPWLAKETAKLGIAAALQTRTDLGQNTLNQAQRFNQPLLQGDSITDIQRGLAKGDSRLNLILAVELADRLKSEALKLAIQDMSLGLATNGRLVLSFFVPGHLGCGWQTIWLGQQIERHCPTFVVGAARAAGLSPRLFHDASNSLVWAELIRSRPQSHVGGNYD